MKQPAGNGYIDFLTAIYLPYNQVRLISSSTPPIPWGPPQPPFDVEITSSTSSTTALVKDWAVAKMEVENAKTANPDVQFLWNVPFFNVTVSTTDLSLGLKTNFGTSTYITSGSRPDNDISQPRKMLVINNGTGLATIVDFDQTAFIENGDQAVEGFNPTVNYKGADAGTPRLFLGVRADGKELVVYCSQGATPAEASTALSDAGVPVDNQLQADGGTSATCAYNMPGQYFVEPGRTLPYLMGATPILYRAKSTTEGLNVRKGPGPKNAIVRKLAKNTPIQIFQEKNGWARISNGQEWVSVSLIKKT
jgi:rhodanese-related sulfurtransferase